jgi:hypothetical protein
MTLSVNQLGGVVIDADISKQVFYGFRFDQKTGHLNIEEISKGSDTIALPQDGVLDPADYKQWLFTKAKLDFRFTANGHLEMVIK